MAVRKTSAGLRLKRWFKEDWRTPKGKKDYKGGENTFRPTKRITKDTPSTWSELTKGEKRKAKMEKTTKGRVSRYKNKKYQDGGLSDKSETRKDYKSYKEKDFDKSSYISPKVTKKTFMPKIREQSIIPGSAEEKRISKFRENRSNKSGRGFFSGNEDLLLEPNRNRITSNNRLKKKGPLRSLLNRKTEKGLVKVKYDDKLTEDSDVVSSTRVGKDYTVKDKGREQRKYVSQGVDSEGDPLKTKVKIKGKKGDYGDGKNVKRDIPTTLDKMKRVNDDETKYVSVVDGKRVKKRGSDANTAREYKRKGLRRVYVDPDSEGNVQYVGTGRKSTKISRNSTKENKKLIKEENRKIREQKRIENKKNKKENRKKLFSSLKAPSQEYQYERGYKEGGVTARKGFHFMKKGEGKYKLMKHGDKPFKKHPGASLEAKFPIQKKHNPKQDAKIAKRKYFLGGLMKKMGKASLGVAGMVGGALKKGKNDSTGAEGKAIDAEQETGGLLGPLYVKASEDKKKKVNEILTAKKGAMVPKKSPTMEDDFLYAAGVIKGDKKEERKLKKKLYAGEEETYRKINRKPPKRNVFKNGGVLVKKKKKDKKFVILNTQEEIDKINKDAAGFLPGRTNLPNFDKYDGRNREIRKKK